MREITFPTASPPCFGAVAAGHRAPGATALGRLFLPQAATRPKSRPAVVILSDLNGAGRAARYGALLAREGYVALVVDSLATRGARGSPRRRALRVTEAAAVADAYGALRHLADHPMVDPERIGVMGTASGGSAALLCAFAQIRGLHAPDLPRFAAHVGLYADPGVRLAEPAATGAPVAVFAGGLHGPTGGARLRGLVADLRRGGARVALHLYPDAGHGWDADPGRLEPLRAPPGCRLVVGADHVTRDERTGLPVRGALSRALALAVAPSGTPARPDEGVTARCDEELVAFLRDSLGRPAYPSNVIPLPLRRAARARTAALPSVE